MTFRPHLTSRTPPSAVARYVVGALAPVAVIVATKLVQGMIQPTLNPAFSVAVAMAALFGGWGPGILASVLSILGYTLFPHMLAGADGVVRVIQFVVIATIITWIAGMAYRQ